MSDRWPTPIRTAAADASACLTTFVNASEIKKYAVLSTTGENRSSGTSNGSMGTGDSSASACTAARRPRVLKSVG
jgi:hypothetical protein